MRPASLFATWPTGPLIADREHSDLQKSDEQLMAAYAKGDKVAFEQLYRRHRAGMWRYLLNMTGPEMCADVFQDTWSRLIAGRDRFKRDQGRFAPWAYRLAHNVAIDALRKASLRVVDELSGDESGADPQPQELIEDSDRVEAFRRCFEQLPRDQKEAWVLREDQGLDLSTIGFVCGTKRETIKSRLRYAIAKLKTCLEAAHGQA
ncbi:MAG: RNA polymerase sigma factor [Lysobacteraceae bacterium]|nr:MAG: RNA polymerase sigma factor [Xanthomonadaceae bacterium]